MRFIQLLCLVIGSTAVSAAPAFALSALVGNAYESYTNFVSCGSGESCTYTFDPTPAGKIIQINNVACRVVTSKAIVEAFFGPSATSGGGAYLLKKTAMKLGNVNYVSPRYYVTLEAGSRVLIGPARYPAVQIYTRQAATMEFECSLDGTVIPG